jgi:hypothetical protein
VGQVRSAVPYSIGPGGSAWGNLSTTRELKVDHSAKTGEAVSPGKKRKKTQKIFLKNEW